LKLIDFGFANANKNNSLTEFVGTPYYVAPEIIKREKYGSACDIWSLGVMAYLLIDGDYPYSGKDQDELFASITSRNPPPFKGASWDNVTEECKKFINDCLTFDQRKRPTAQKLLNHPWILMYKGDGKKT
jgi:serine/threonine protein kinase